MCRAGRDGTAGDFKGERGRAWPGSQQGWNRAQKGNGLPAWKVEDRPCLGSCPLQRAGCRGWVKRAGWKQKKTVLAGDQETLMLIHILGAKLKEINSHPTPTPEHFPGARLSLGAEWCRIQVPGFHRAVRGSCAKQGVEGTELFQEPCLCQPHQDTCR